MTATTTAAAPAKSAARGWLTLADVERDARARALPHGVWDFLTGGAGEEATVAANQAAFRQWRLRRRVCVDVSRLDLETTLLGTRWPLPLCVAPTGLQEMWHPGAEVATAAAAAACGVPMVVSAMASRTIEEIAAAAPDAVLWQQVWIFRDRDLTASLVRRAEETGAEAIVVTVDAPWLGRRLRDLRNAFRAPVHVQARNLAASLPEAPDVSSPAAHAATAMDPAVTWDDIRWLTELTHLPVVVKGVELGFDAAQARIAGAAAVVVSNHGGRQLDRCTATLDALPGITAALPTGYPVLLDGGIRSGIDVMIALARGATAVMVGRPVLHGLAAAGQDGVREVLDLLGRELADAMGLAGRPTLAALDATALTPARSPDPTPAPAPAPVPPLPSTGEGR